MNIIFDLDGTLIDSSHGVLSSLRSVLEMNQITPVHELEPSLIGPPLGELIQVVTGEDDEELITKLSKQFIEHYDEKVYSETEYFDGMDEALAKIKNKAHKVFIATNKRHVPTQKIIDMFLWNDFFDEIYSLDQFPLFIDKSDLLAYILSAHELDKDSTLYIGDTESDKVAAQKANIDYLMVGWGYGGMNECHGKMLTPKHLVDYLFGILH